MIIVFIICYYHSFCHLYMCDIHISTVNDQTTYMNLILRSQSELQLRTASRKTRPRRRRTCGRTVNRGVSSLRAFEIEAFPAFRSWPEAAFFALGALKGSF